MNNHLYPNYPNPNLPPYTAANPLEFPSEGSSIHTINSQATNTSPQGNGFFGSYPVAYTAATQQRAFNPTATVYQTIPSMEFPGANFMDSTVPYMSHQSAVPPMNSNYLSPAAFNPYPPINYANPFPEYAAPMQMHNPYSYNNYSAMNYAPAPIQPAFQYNNLAPSAPMATVIHHEIIEKNAEPQVSSTLIEFEQELTIAKNSLFSAQAAVDEISQKIAVMEASMKTLQNPHQLNDENKYIETISRLYSEKEQLIHEANDCRLKVADCEIIFLMYTTQI